MQRNHHSPTKARKRVGWILSTLVVLVYCSPQAQFLRSLPDTLSVAVGQYATLDASFPLQIDMEESDVQALSSTDDQLGDSVYLGTNVGSSQATISLFGLIPLKTVEVNVSDDLVLYPGGQAVGVALQTDGVLIVGTSDFGDGYSPAQDAGLKPGDVITDVGDEHITSTAELSLAVSSLETESVAITVMRGESILELELSPQFDEQTETFRIGAWVRDSTAGVGTLSFYGEVTPDGGICYGALGHAITDSDTQQVLTVGGGEVMQADIVDIRKGESGIPGELKGSFLQEDIVLGNITKNNVYGIYGDMDDPPTNPLYPDGISIGRRDAVHTGAATILSTVDGEGIKEYDVEIVEVARQSEPSQRSMVIKVTDEELLEKTNGIVQGMSGSPIIQDGRLIGAVTHVFINDPTMGYGLFIEWMLAQQVE